MKTININKNNIFNFENYLWEKNLSKGTIQEYIKTLNRFLKFSDYKISKEISVKWIRNLQERLLKPETIRTGHAHLMQFCVFMKFEWVKEFKLIKLPKRANMTKVVVKKEKIDSILDDLNLDNFNDLRIYVWIRILFETGLRTCEFMKLKTKDFLDFETGIEIIGKGSKLRKVFFSQNLSEFILKNWKYENICVLKKGSIASNQMFRKIMSDFFKLKNLKGVSIHTMRRSFCTNLIKKNCNLKMVQMLMGHSDIKTTSKYIFFDDQDLYQEYTRCL